ncbi:GNAT family N-acetyltransferase [Lentibacillus halodurans]|nr:GNAT family N-acetyltransferase [Lentibacillus halodurans]
MLDEEFVGFACAQSYRSFCYSSAQGEMTELYVEEKARRLGFASSLIALLEVKTYVSRCQKYKGANE